MPSRDERASGVLASGEMNGKRFAERINVAHGTVKRWLHEGMPARRDDHHHHVWIDPVAADAWIATRFGGRKTVAFDRTSIVYFVQREEGPIKIGFTSDIVRRLAELRKDAGSAVALLACFPGGKPDELRMHERFAPWAIGEEWYARCDELIAFIDGLKERAA
jgi:hypothetical protein